MNEEISSFEYVQPKKTFQFYAPEYSEWKCYMFGNNPKIDDGISYRPKKGQEPNWFARWMMKICFDCTWVKDKK
jgi:hypothetical protein